MARIFPFRAAKYDRRKVGIERVITEPFMYITEQMRSAYYEGDEYSFAHALDGCTQKGDSPEENKYVRAGMYLDKWFKEGILVYDNMPSLYVYQQEFSTGFDSKRVTRKGFIALGKLDEIKDTLPDSRPEKLTVMADRFALLQATKSNLEPLSILYADPGFSVDSILDEAIKKKRADITVRDSGGSTHSLWEISDGEVIKAVQKNMTSKKSFILNGFYECHAALRYRDFMLQNGHECEGDESFDNYLAYFVNMDDSGLIIRSHNRLISGLNSFNIMRIEAKFSEYFKIQTFDYRNDEEEKEMRLKLIKELTLSSSRSHSFGMAVRNVKKYYLLTMKITDAAMQELLTNVPEKLRRLDTVILDNVVLRHLLELKQSEIESGIAVKYIEDSNETMDNILQKKSQLGFILNYPRSKQLRELAVTKIEPPPGTVDFYPRLPAGLLFSKLNVVK